MFGKWLEKGFLLAVSARISTPLFTFKTSDLNFEYLSEHDGYIPAPYFANRGMKWIQQTETSGVLDEELKYYLSESYRLVVLGLSQRLQKELGITPRADGESAS
ncbi:hypothetical protein VCSRO2_3590 [Vibrio cholerae]|nr:hypothetical protein Sa5Y_VCA03165 [Vibrio cholerae]GHX03042.1 hypothetical protein VCSRO2_3590 [Vibrio cholerae]